jgi:predicted SnoaL-like aldol condensation-catalyzing enzyme
MTKVKSFLVITAFILLAVSCGGGSNDSPAGIEKAMYSQLQKGNYEKAAELLADNLESDKTPSAEEKAEFVKAFAEKAKQSTEARGGVKSFEIVKETISEDGESATVETRVIYGDGKEEIQTTKYVKKDGIWKLSFDK